MRKTNNQTKKSECEFCLSKSCELLALPSFAFAFTL